MARIKDRHIALELRKQGKSYSQIKKILNISKGTLSYWLRDYPLSKEQIRKLRDWNAVRIEKFRKTMRKKRNKRLKLTYSKQKARLIPLSERELFLSGLFLYLGEGTKGINRAIIISNSDPQIIKFGLYWLVKILKIPKNKIKIFLHLYDDMNIKNEHKYWSAKLNMSLNNFRKPYIKLSKRKNINHKGGYSHGTCNIIVGNVKLKEKILMAIKAIIDNYQ